MVMDTLQIRMSHGLVKLIDSLVGTGLYSNRSDAIRDAVRKLVLDQMVGILPNTGDSVKEIHEIRKRLSKGIKSFKDIGKINRLVD